MELRKPQIARFVWNDVTFLVNCRASSGDKFAIDTCNVGRKVKRGGTTIREVDQTTFGKLLIQLFVVGWEGVTSEGKPVPYTFEAIDDLPADPKRQVLTELCHFILKNVDIFKDQEIKNDSGAQSNGSQSGEHSPVPAATV